MLTWEGFEGCYVVLVPWVVTWAGTSRKAVLLALPVIGDSYVESQGIDAHFLEDRVIALPGGRLLADAREVVVQDPINRKKRLGKVQ